MNLKQLLVLLASGVALVAGMQTAYAQGAFPNKPVRIIIGFGPGSGTDILSRLVAEELRIATGQPFLVDNRPGAGSAIAAVAVAKAPPDGYTLFLTSNSSHSVNPHIVKNLPYNAITDFTPIAGLATFPFTLSVNGDIPVRTAQEFVTWARAQPAGKLNYAYGTPAVLIIAESLNRTLKLGATGIPYKSSPDAQRDVIGGQAQFLIADLASARAHLQSGRLRALAATTGKRTALAPDLPTIEEALGLRDFDLSAWTGMFGPASVPKDVVDKLSGTVMQVMAKQELRDKITSAGAEPTPTDAVAFTALVKRQLDMWGRKVAEAGVKPE